MIYTLRPASQYVRVNLLKITKKILVGIILFQKIVYIADPDPKKVKILTVLV